nr:NADH dehydrogenase subunit 6 [Bactronophorus thoracites]
MVTICTLIMGVVLLSLTFLKHPLDVSGCLMVAGVVGATVLSFSVSCLMGFALFMVMVGGVLVFIAFCVALVPYLKNFQVAWGNGSFSVSLKYGLLGFMVFLGVLLMCVDPVSTLYSSRGLAFRGVEGFMCTESWALVMILLALYLLVAIIAGVVISSKYTGALVNKGWHNRGLLPHNDLSFRQSSKIGQVAGWM